MKIVNGVLLTGKHRRAAGISDLKKKDLILHITQNQGMVFQEIDRTERLKHS